MVMVGAGQMKRGFISISTNHQEAEDGGGGLYMREHPDATLVAQAPALAAEGEAEANQR